MMTRTTSKQSTTEAATDRENRVRRGKVRGQMGERGKERGGAWGGEGKWRVEGGRVRGKLMGV